ncbi:MAG: xylose isomerase [Sphaerochaetaceae bacterium]
MREVFIGSKEYFKGINKINYEGLKSDNPLSFKIYNPKEIVAGKTMEEHLRFSIAYWHSFCDNGGDPFGNPTKFFPWDDKDPMKAAKNKAEAAFEFFTKIGAPFYAFHDLDVSPEGETATEYENNYFEITKLLKELQEATGVQLLWNTTNLTRNPRFMNGAITNPDFSIMSRAAFNVKTNLDVNLLLGGHGFTFWGGREGYNTLWNTDTKRELDHLGQFYQMIRDYAKKIGFKGVFYIEPKPMEPSKHQYDFDAATAISFIKEYGLEDVFKCNIEANHATLAGHSFAHDLQVCVDNRMLGSIDANQGDPQNGWDTDEFPTNIYDVVQAMYIVLNNGGFTSGGLNFDAKTRRNSTDLEDLFIAHIGGMDTFALGLKVASRMIEKGDFKNLVKERYNTFDSGDGSKFEKGGLSLVELANIGKNSLIEITSGKQELINNLINQYIFRQ